MERGRWGGGEGGGWEGGRWEESMAVKGYIHTLLLQFNFCASIYENCRSMHIIYALINN